MVMMPLTVSITEGIAFGFIAYAILKLCTGRGRGGAPARLRVRRAVRGALHLAGVINRSSLIPDPESLILNPPSPSLISNPNLDQRPGMGIGD